MGKPLLVVSSVTYAMKGRELLFRHGIRGYVERIPKTQEPAAVTASTSPGADAAERILLETMSGPARMEHEEDLV